MKATPLPDSIEIRHGGLERATCRHEGGRIFRTRHHETDRPLPWVHVETQLTTCGEKIK